MNALEKKILNAAILKKILIWRGYFSLQVRTFLLLVEILPFLAPNPLEVAVAHSSINGN